MLEIDDAVIANCLMDQVMYSTDQFYVNTLNSQLFSIHNFQSSMLYRIKACVSSVKEIFYFLKT